MIARWLFVNILTVFIIVLWTYYQGYDNNDILVGKMLSQAAFILFLINLNMYFVFLLIRKSKIRDVKVTLAKISKKMMKYHIPIAVTATLLIIGHTLIMINANWKHFLQVKAMSGCMAIIILGILLFSGLLRRWKATGRRRKFHYMMAFSFFGFVLLHIFL
ncbi:hypothetical protein RCG23_01040 [Neobacillus sp. PS3-34]|uniref:hypothetical protein n=1 Tax=Neobacillus sp. PS3-34 TaxID=3070678 RepID=UPI0027E184DE|nr:hypothetical protein [Neobacillus sp. PS3-34]WML48758.1 hypothetical protein RCG23_01040 [Neobacillus sp. PS3-34]